MRVTNALSKRLEVSVWREGQVATLAFAGGDVIEPLKIRKATNADRRCGTSARAWPDAKYFETGELPKADLTHLLRSKAVLMPGVTVTLNVEKTGDKQTWLYKGGLRDYLMQALVSDPVIPLFEGAHYADGGETENFAEGEGAAWRAPNSAAACPAAQAERHRTQTNRDAAEFQHGAADLAAQHAACLRNQRTQLQDPTTPLGLSTAGRLLQARSEERGRPRWITCFASTVADRSRTVRYWQTDARVSRTGAATTTSPGSRGSSIRRSWSCVISADG
jgi:hypothetical protein